jgi:hypothetical protein
MMFDSIVAALSLFGYVFAHAQIRWAMRRGQ